MEMIKNKNEFHHWKTWDLVNSDQSADIFISFFSFILNSQITVHTHIIVTENYGILYIWIEKIIVDIKIVTWEDRVESKTERCWKQ